MRNKLNRLLAEYAIATRQQFADHPVAQFIRDTVPPALKAVAGDQAQGMKFAGRPGNGRWTDTPCIEVSNPLVTTTPQEGYYVAYIASRNLDRLVLSLQIGTTNLKQNLGQKAAAARLQDAVALIQDRVPEYKSRFNTQPINLQPTGPASRAASYQLAHAFGKTYRGVLPAEETLQQDLREMIRLYRLLTYRGGIDELEQPDPLLSSEMQDAIGEEDRRRYRYHRRIDRNRKLAEAAKKIHGYICQACGFNYAAAYGPLGAGYIEAHHLTPLAQLAPNSSVKLSAQKDFAVVCASCHRMIHRQGAPVTFDEFKVLVANIRNHIV